MKIANGIAMLELSTEAMGQSRSVNPTLLWEGGAVILVDTGYPGQISQIRTAVDQAGADFDRLNMIVITHHDLDHIGSLENILKELPGVQVLAHEVEKPYLLGEKRPLKLAQMEATLSTMAPEMKPVYTAFSNFYNNLHLRVDHTLTDGEKLPYCGGITVIFTPGHTLGHICLYLDRSKTLVAGDSLRVDDGQLIKAWPHSNYDSAQNARSLKKLAQFDIENVICYHGGFYQQGDVNQRIAALAAEAAASA